MKLLFTIAYVQYTIDLQIYLLKRSIDKVVVSGFQAIKVSGDVENESIVYNSLCTIYNRHLYLLLVKIYMLKRYIDKVTESGTTGNR